MKSEGIRTLVRKLRLCQSARGRKRTRVERLVLAPASEAWRTTFLRLFLGKRIGTFAKAYRLPQRTEKRWGGKKDITHWRAKRFKRSWGASKACFSSVAISGVTEIRLPCDYK